MAINKAETMVRAEAELVVDDAPGCPLEGVGGTGMKVRTALTGSATVVVIMLLAG